MVKLTLSFVTVLLVLPVVLIAGCNKPSDASLKSEQVPITIVKKQMSVHEFSGDVLQSIAVVSGTAQNTGDRNLQSATIEAYYFDKNGNALGSATAVTQDLAPGALWNFTIQFKGADAWKAVTYDLSIATGNKP